LNNNGVTAVSIQIAIDFLNKKERVSQFLHLFVTGAADEVAFRCNDHKVSVRYKCASLKLTTGFLFQKNG